MTTTVNEREFLPGTSGWSVDDLDDPAIEALWFAGKYELVEGVLTRMPAAYFDGGIALSRLLHVLRNYTMSHGLGDGFAMEVDVILNKRRLPVVDAIFLTPQDQEKQKHAHAATGKRKHLKYGRILIPPTLIIESLRIGHESHDRETKRGWYAEANVPNYWLLDAAQRTLECLVLDGADYRVDAAGQGDAVIDPSLFPKLRIELGRLWVE